MNQQQKEQWLAALRSGKYPQGRGFLKSSITGGYCCLGVAREACSLEGISGNRLLVSETVSWIFLPERTQGELARMNDAGKDFAAIADYIEQHIEPTE
jgi:hypothetical protein